MSIEPPKKEDLKRIAKENHFEMTDSEAEAIDAMFKPIIPFLDHIDQAPIEPSASVKELSRARRGPASDSRGRSPQCGGAQNQRQGRGLGQAQGQTHRCEG